MWQALSCNGIQALIVVLVDLDQLIWSLVLNGAFYLSCNKLTELCNNMHAKCMKVFPLWAEM